MPGQGGQPCCRACQRPRCRDKLLSSAELCKPRDIPSKGSQTYKMMFVVTLKTITSDDMVNAETAAIAAAIA